jgi:hypothetical protein
VTGPAVTPEPQRGEPGACSAEVPDLARLPWRPEDAGQVLYSYSTPRFTCDRGRFAFVAFMFAFGYVIGLGITAGHAVTGDHWVGGQLTSLITGTVLGALVFAVMLLASPGTARLQMCHRGLIIYARRARHSPYVVPYLTIDPVGVLVRNRYGAYQSISFFGLDPALAGRGQPREHITPEPLRSGLIPSQSFHGVPVTRWFIDTAQPERVLRELERAMVSAGVLNACGITDRALGEWETAEPPRKNIEVNPDYRPHHARHPPGPLARRVNRTPEGVRWAAYAVGMLGFGFVLAFIVGVLKIPAGLIRLMGHGAKRSAKAVGNVPGRVRGRGDTAGTP